MKLHVLFHHPEDDPRLMPNAIAVMDEYTVEAAGLEVWWDEMEKAKESMGPGSFREAVVTVLDQEISALFDVPEVDGEVQR